MKCSEWVTTNRIIRGASWKFDNYAYLRPLHDVVAERIIIPKGAQLGLTETAMNRAFYTMIMNGRDAFYLLPTGGDASDFSAGRFNPAIEESPMLARFFTDVDNVGHKRAGLINLWVRGSNSRARLKSVPISDLTIDEFDEANQDNVSLVRERKSGTLDPTEMDLSTPTITGYGIWGEWEISNKHHWYLVCVHCGHKQHLNIKDNLEWKQGKPETARYKCVHCQ